MKITSEMEQAGDRVIHDWDSRGLLENRGYGGLALEIFKAMVKAAPIEFCVMEMIGKSNERS